MQIENIEKLISEYNNQANILKKQLESIGKMISNGIIPPENETDEMNRLITSISENYNCIYELMVTVADTENILERGLSVIEYAASFESSLVKFVSIENLLLEFLRLKSDINTYEVVLKPFKDRAEKILSEIKLSETVDESKYYSFTAACRLLLESVSVDMTTEKGTAFLKNLSGYYPSEILFGIAAGAYYKTEPENPKEEKFDEDIISVESVLPNNAEPFISNTDDITDHVDDIAEVETESEPEPLKSPKNNYGIDIPIGKNLADYQNDEDKKVSHEIYETIAVMKNSNPVIQDENKDRKTDKILNNIMTEPIKSNDGKIRNVSYHDTSDDNNTEKDTVSFVVTSEPQDEKEYVSSSKKNLTTVTFFRSFFKK